MNKKMFFGAALAVVATGSLMLTSCYNNKTDIISLPKSVSFVNDVVPILISGACGCHNNGTPGSANVKQFSNVMKRNNGGDTIYYDAIYSEGATLQKWAEDSIGHPGGGSVTLSASDIAIIQKWAALDFPDDQSSGSTGNVTFSGTIASIISSTCSGGSCHGTNGGGGAGPALNYVTLSSTYNSTLQGYLNKNWSGHGGGVQSPSVTATLKDWIAAGMPQ